MVTLDALAQEKTVERLISNGWLVLTRLRSRASVEHWPKRSRYVLINLRRGRKLRIELAEGPLFVEINPLGRKLSSHLLVSCVKRTGTLSWQTGITEKAARLCYDESEGDIELVHRIVSGMERARKQLLRAMEENTRWL